MPAAMKLHLQRVHFGLAAPGAILKFAIAPVPGFAVTAVLDCDLKVVASWEWVELKDGVIIEETLTPKGTYTLTLHVVFTGTAAATAEMAFAVNAIRKARKMTGQKPDIGRALAVVIVK